MRFKKLRRIAEEITGQKIEITFSTELVSVLGILVKEEGFYRILLNANKVKSEVTAICVISHELAHLMLQLEGKRDRGKNLVEKQKEILRKFVDAFENSITFDLAEEELMELQRMYGGFDE